MPNTIIFPGSFDPITNGHIDLINRALKIFPHGIIIAIAQNNKKDSCFDLQKRIEICKLVLQDKSKIQVIGFDGLLIELLQKYQSSTIIRGIRAISDFEFELQLANVNRKLYNKFETIFLTPAEKYSFISSTIVKEIASLGGNINEFVHPIVAQELKIYFGK